MFQSQTRRLLPRNYEHTHAEDTGGEFQSQTRRLLPRNLLSVRSVISVISVSIADATLASPQPGVGLSSAPVGRVSIADATLASPQPPIVKHFAVVREVSIADATLASPQRRPNGQAPPMTSRFQSQTRRLLPRNVQDFATADWHYLRFNRRRDACFPATQAGRAARPAAYVSIADATLASPQPLLL